jgi:CHAT domain-containing protein
MMKAQIALAVALVGLSLAPSQAQAPLSVRDSFRIGSSGTSYCSAQPLVNDPGLRGMFDNVYSITCRDAVLPVGKIYKLALDGTGPAARLEAMRSKTVRCAAPSEHVVESLGRATFVECKLVDADVDYRIVEYTKGNSLFVAEGLTGYDSALQLGLRSVIADRPVPGEVSIATTGVGNAVDFARVQAGTLDPTRALIEAYRRNNLGSYADSAEFFAAANSSSTGPITRAEALMNEALQKSNLGRDAEANSLFARAQAEVGDDPVDQRRFRNYRAIHLLNQGEPDEALNELKKPISDFGARQAAQRGTALAIDAKMSQRLNAEAGNGALDNKSDDLLPEEKAEILDGQALQLRGASLLVKGDDVAAGDALQSADTSLLLVRGGRVTSIAWMRAQIADDLAAIAEHKNEQAQADSLYQKAISILEKNYPGSAALLSADARFAAYLARSGNPERAQALFREIVHSETNANNLPPSFARLVRPYIDLLLEKHDDPAATAEVFATTQLMIRPGLAQTQAILARQLSAGSGEAARLFRQAVTLSREVERNRVALTRIDDVESPSAEQLKSAAALRSNLESERSAALATQASLAAYPRYLAVSSDLISLADLQKILRPGEAYYRMTVVEDGIYAMFITPSSARAAKLPISAKALDDEVTALRDTITTMEGGQRVTYPYDASLAHKLYTDLFGPFHSELAQVKHFIFEPDGAMLRMPVNPLVVDQASVDMYARRVASDPKAEFDFTGVNWLGRNRGISTSVSPRSFANLREAAASTATKEYLGLGHNTPAAANAAQLVPAAMDRDCILPLSNWSRPISGKELHVAANILEKLDPTGVSVVTGDGFTDKAIAARGDLKEYRIVHFATHGVVTATRPKCPTQPALLTSFGGQDSDGLLTFREIFDLDLDADVVILSACDTAGKATAIATQSAGLGAGGDVELDGLVRAFVGAGGRLVVASHWPVPDDFNATEKLITGLFTTAPGTPTVTALRLSEQKLMDDPNTSHPFYWAAFAAVGDGDIPLIRLPAKAPDKFASSR